MNVFTGELKCQICDVTDKLVQCVLCNVVVCRGCRFDHRPEMECIIRIRY